MTKLEPTHPTHAPLWEKLSRYAEEARVRSGVPGLALALVYTPDAGPSAVATEGFGHRKAGEAGEVGPATVFPLASLSKPIASTILARLVAEGTIRWDDRVPGATKNPDTTLRQLFAHRSGLPGHAGDSIEDLGGTREEVLARLPELALAVGTYNYTNFGLTAGAVWAAGKAGKAWEDLAHDALFAPAGMTRTSARHAVLVDWEDRAWGHRRTSAGWVCLEDAQRQPDAQSPAGGVSASVCDLARWVALQLGDRTIGSFDEAFFTELANTHVPYAADGAYALGWNAGVDAATGSRKISHSGAFVLGAGTCVTILSDRKLGVVVLTNGEPIGVAEAVCAAFLRLVADPELTVEALLRPLSGEGSPTLLDAVGAAMHAELYPPPKHPLTPGPTDPDPDRYVGTYTSPFYGSLQISETDTGGLVLTLGPRARTFPLRPYGVDELVYDSPGENGAAFTPVTFGRDPAGLPISVTLWNLLVPYELSVGPATTAPVDGTIRSVDVTYAGEEPARFRLTAGAGASLRTSEERLLTKGPNALVVPGLAVSEGEPIGFQVDPGAEIEVTVEIDREGTFERV